MSRDGRHAARGVGALALLLVSLLLAGCTVGPQAGPERIQSARAIGPAPPPSNGAVVTMIVYFVKDGRLAGVSRSVPSKAGLDGVLQALGRGPTTQEAAAGYSTALPTGTTTLQAATVLDGIVSVIVPTGLDSLGVARQVTAVGQMVFTVTEIDGVSGLQLTDGQHAVEIPVSGGALVSGPVDRSDYSDIAPR